MKPPRSWWEVTAIELLVILAITGLLFLLWGLAA
jgi:hypothetical protein